jgi:hypothetical protein
VSKFVVIAEWTDGEVDDADEVVIVAATAQEALSKAKSKWRMTIGAEWPNCRLRRCRLLTPAESKKLI